MRNELFHYTREQAIDHLTVALNIVEQLDPPSDLRVAVFDKAITMLSAKNISIEQVQPHVFPMAIPKGR